jgi:hypothetical protein
MSLFNWLSPRKPAKARPDGSDASPTQPQRLDPAGAVPPNRKSERMARREMLYSVVRESMARAGVLSASYKFKVLSLDAAGRQFLVMVDLASSERADAELLGEIEAGVIQRAKGRHELVVSAVYWRRNDQVGVNAARESAARQQSRAMQAGPSQPAELVSEPAALQPTGASAGTGFDPIQDEEMAAFKAALAAAKAGSGASGLGPATDGTGAAAGRARDPRATLARGFDDTQMPDQEPRTRTLSPTQAGDLN